MTIARFYLKDEDVMQRGNWIPPVDIYETEAHDLVVKAELPDMTREDIEVTVEKDTLTIRGTKKLPEGIKKKYKLEPQVVALRAQVRVLGVHIERHGRRAVFRQGEIHAHELREEEDLD